MSKIRWQIFLSAGLLALSANLSVLRDYLKERREFLLRLLENPNILLTEELCARRTLIDLSAVDYKHLANDIKRAYKLLALEWIFYMRHLQKDYPYLFSLASRMNPFNPQASAEIR